MNAPPATKHRRFRAAFAFPHRTSAAASWWVRRHYWRRLQRVKMKSKNAMNEAPSASLESNCLFGAARACRNDWGGFSALWETIRRNHQLRPPRVPGSATSCDRMTLAPGGGPALVAAIPGAGTGVAARP
jgi:hypothetical protein